MSMRRLGFPSHFIAFTSSFFMMDALMTLHYVKAFIYSVPFMFFIASGTFMNRQASLAIGKIELIEGEDEVAEDI